MLQAMPSTALDQRFTHQEFITATRLWLGGAVLEEDAWCPACDQILDTRATHSLACMAWGDAVLTHNLI